MSRYYDEYWKREASQLRDFPFKWPAIKHLIPKNKDITILDYGCGKGKILKEVAKLNKGAKLFGVDVSETALDSARKSLPRAKFFKSKDGGRLPLKEGSVDFVLATDVLEHVYETEKTLLELSRVLKRDGQILVTTPYHGLIKNLVIVLFYFDTVFNPTGPHIRFYSKKSLFALLSQFGLEAVRLGFYGRFPPLWRAMYVLAEKK